MEKKVLCGLVVLLMSTGFLSAGTIAYWQLDEDTGVSVLVDAVGGNDLTYQSGSPDAAAVNPVPNPDPGPFSVGTPAANPASMVLPTGGDASSNAAFGMHSSPWTFEGWIKRDNSSSNAIGCTRSAETTWTGWELMCIHNGRIDLRMSDVAGSSYVNTGTVLAPLNEWAHFALVWDPTAGATGTASIYLDGVLANSGPGRGDLGTQSGLIVGGRDKAADGVVAATELFWEGSMDELRFSDAALDPSEFLNIPEPTTLGLLALGMVFGFKRKRF
jgi:hypothetical protein